MPIETRGNGGTLVTGGDLVFHATRGGAFRAYDAWTGEILWQSAVGPGPGTPITYSYRDRQFISVPSGGRIWTFGLPQERSDR